MMPRFTADDVDRANAEWGCNCGPAALAAICGLTLGEVRPMLGETWPGYTNPTCMARAIRRAGECSAAWTTVRIDSSHRPLWPRYGIARIQWDGPWMQPSVPMRARYRYTHWVGVSRLQRMDGTEDPSDVFIWDVNELGALNDNGWMPVRWWTHRTVPRLTSNIPRASGGWRVTHAYEVSRPLTRNEPAPVAGEIERP